MKILSPAPQSEALSDETFEELRTFIYETTGIYFRDNKRYLLESQVGNRLSALRLSDYDTYFHWLKNKGKKRELPHLVNSITINETFFFRHPVQHDLILDTLVPELAAQARAEGRRQLRFWSAGCSTGDEPYTLAMGIRERAQPRFPDVAFDINGGDINTNVLKHARGGVYTSHSVRNVPTFYLHRYFERKDDRYVIKDAIRKMVTFQYVNLVDALSTNALPQQDVIVCANVLIYFDKHTKEKVVANLFGNLREGGYLLVGGSETLFSLESPLQPRRFPRATIYRKAAQEVEPASKLQHANDVPIHSKPYSTQS